MLFLLLVYDEVFVLCGPFAPLDPIVRSNRYFSSFRLMLLVPFSVFFLSFDFLRKVKTRFLNIFCHSLFSMLLSKNERRSRLPNLVVLQRCNGYVQNMKIIRVL